MKEIEHCLKQLAQSIEFKKKYMLIDEINTQQEQNVKQTFVDKLSIFSIHAQIKNTVI